MPIPHIKRQLKPEEPAYPLEVCQGITAGGAEVAVKIVQHRPNDPQLIQWAGRLVARAQLARRIKHENLVPVLEVGNDSGKSYVASQYIHGRPGNESVQQLCSAGGVIPIDRCVRIVWNVAAALECVHKATLVHGCIKPSKIMLQPHPRDGTFDAVKLRDAAIGDLRIHRPGRDAIDVTTALYLAPELIGEGTEPNIRSDIYSLGVVFYRLLTGFVPFGNETEDINTIFFEKLGLKPAPEVIARQPGMDHTKAAELDKVLRKMLALRPDDRFQNPTELRDRLQQLADSLGIRLAPPVLPPPPVEPRYWRDGPVLVVEHGAVLRGCCVRCNDPVPEGVKEYELHLHPSWVYFLLLVPGVLLYAVGTLCLQQTTRVKMGLCGRHRTQRMVVWCAAVITAFLGMSLLVYSYTEDSVLIAICGLIVLIGAGIIGVMGRDVVALKYLDKRVCWISGAGEPFLRDCSGPPTSTSTPRTAAAQVPSYSVD